LAEKEREKEIVLSAGPERRDIVGVLSQKITETTEMVRESN
jgi:hypothetical protein